MVIPGRALLRRYVLELVKMSSPQIIDRKIQMLTRVIFRIVGRLILQGPNRGGGGGGGDDGDDERRIQITLPTYPPDELDDEDEDSTDSTTSGDHSETTTNSVISQCACLKRKADSNH